MPLPLNFIAPDSDPWAEEAGEGDRRRLPVADDALPVSRPRKPTPQHNVPSELNDEAEKQLRHARQQNKLTQRYPGRTSSSD
jgi:hypothetical protein